MNWQLALSILGVLIESLGIILYIRTIISGESKPHRITWGGWTLVGILGLLSSLEGGAGIGLVVTLTFTIGVFAIFCFSLLPKYGKPGGTRAELVAGMIAALALLTKLFVDYPPGLGATIAILADLVFLWPTLKASWYQPDTEALHPWAIGAVAAVLGVIALGTYTYGAAGYSVYILLGNLAIITALLIRKPQRQKKPKKLKSQT